MRNPVAVPAVPVAYTQDGTSTTPNDLGMRRCKNAPTKNAVNRIY